MKTSNFEVAFIKTLNEHVERNYSHLEFIVPQPGSFGGPFTVPDAILYNQRTAEAIAIEIKGGTSENSVPSAIVQKLKAMKELQLPSKHRINKVIVALVTSAFLPPTIKSTLEIEGIYCITLETTGEFVKVFDPVLRKFASGQI
jgi:hypothetical protein